MSIGTREALIEMAMNRAQRRYLQKQGQLDSEGNPKATPRQPQRPPTRGERAGFFQYISEVRAEMRRVSWPTRAEVLNYTIVVLVTLFLLTGFIALLDVVFSTGVIELLRLGQ